MEERAERLALYIIENRATVRAAAAKFGISKSTVHKDISERLPHFNRTLYLQEASQGCTQQRRLPPLPLPAGLHPGAACRAIIQ